MRTFRLLVFWGALLPLAEAAYAGSLFFPQFVNGQLNGVSNRTRIILTNNSLQPDSGTILFSDARGAPSTVPIGGQSVSSVPYSVSPLGTFEVSTDGTGTPQSGVVEVRSLNDGASVLDGVLIFDYLGHRVSVRNSPVAKAHRIYVTFTRNEFTGFAFFNPDAANTLSATLTLVDDKGAEQATRQFSLEPQHQLVRFVHEDDLFGDYFKAHTQDFHGSMTVDVSSGAGLALLGLLEDGATGALLALPGGNIVYASANGRQILGVDGKPLQLRGINLGGWLVQEGYILHIPGYGSPSGIRAGIQDLLGAADTSQFYDLYRSQYVTERDIARISSWGLNSIRVPFHYNLLFDSATGRFLQSGFDLLSTLAGWCRRYQVYLILDMHCAPGGQNKDNISDSDGQVARLWTDTANQDTTVRIWSEIARRFVHEPYVLGYDLLNEPVLPSGTSNSVLRAFYLRLATEIRKVDPHHILFIEGNWYASDFSLLTPPFDSNLVYSFHKYWSPTDVGTIQQYLDIRNSFNAPLWLGEFGENSNAWGYDIIRLMEQNAIGWCWWTYKKFDSISSPLSAPISAQYQTVLDYWNGKAARPSASDARSALWSMAADLALDRCAPRPDVQDVLTNPSYGDLPKPYAKLSIPGTVNMPDYDIGNEGVSYHDSVFEQTVYQGDVGNNGWSYRNDGVDLEKSTDAAGFAYDVGWIDDGEWLGYTVDVAGTGAYQADFRIASQTGGGILRLLIDGQPAAQDLTVPATGGWKSWQTATLGNVSLTSGKHTMKVLFIRGGFNINSATFRRTS